MPPILPDQISSQCLQTGCQLFLALQMQETIRKLETELRMQDISWAVCLWCDPGKHSFSARDIDKASMVINHRGEDVKVMACSQHARDPIDFDSLGKTEPAAITPGDSIMGQRCNAREYPADPSSQCTRLVHGDHNHVNADGDLYY